MSIVVQNVHLIFFTSSGSHHSYNHPTNYGSRMTSQVIPLGRDKKNSNITLGTICLANSSFNYKQISPIIEIL